VSLSELVFESSEPDELELLKFVELLSLPLEILDMIELEEMALFSSSAVVSSTPVIVQSKRTPPELVVVLVQMKVIKDVTSPVGLRKLKNSAVLKFPFSSK
jgi:hypothetical protein